MGSWEYVGMSSSGIKAVVIVTILVIVVTLVLVAAVGNSKSKKSLQFKDFFKEEYGLTIPKGIRVSPTSKVQKRYIRWQANKSNKGRHNKAAHKLPKKYAKKLRKINSDKYESRGNSFSLATPTWVYAKKDGSHDDRFRSMEVANVTSTALIDGYRLHSNNFIPFYHFIVELRNVGIDIPQINEESEAQSIYEQELIAQYQKDNVLSQAVPEEQNQTGIVTIDYGSEAMNRLFSEEMRSKTATARGIHKHFSPHPYMFEDFCALILQCKGYEAEVTPHSNDGGYDIVLRKDGKVTLVECKCYRREGKIDRPMLQKLVGANAAVGADNLMFISTCDFSGPSVQYADEVGMELINGNRLSAMFKGIIKEARRIEDEQSIPDEVVSAADSVDESADFVIPELDDPFVLSEEYLWSRIPDDMRCLFTADGYFKGSNGR